MSVDRVEHIDLGGKRVIRIVWHHPFSAFASPVKHGGHGPKIDWAPMITDWMPAEVAAELAQEIQKALRAKPLKTPRPKRKAAAAPVRGQ